MRRRILVVLVAVLGCGPDEHADVAVDAAIDSAIDAAIDPARMPFTTTGTTPAGPLDDVRYLAVGYFGGFCQPGYYLELYRTNEIAAPVVLRIVIPIADEPAPPPSGTIAARAWPGDNYDQRTDDVRFEIAHLDLPPTTPLRIAGRVTASTGAWHLDFSLDHSTVAQTCL